MRTRTLYALFVLIILTFATARLDATVYAATPTPTPKATSTAVADAEVERVKKLTKELSLNLPDQTEDPNYPVTFVDPSKQGVEITVDEKPATKAVSPYLLPNLAIGEHTLRFRFKGKDGIFYVLTKSILITPKAPQFDATLKTEVIKPNSVTLKGTALPLSTILLVVNSHDTHKFTANADGKWEFILPNPETGTNNIMAFAIKEGIVSSPSKTFTVQFKLSGTEATTTQGTVKKENSMLTTAKQLLSNINTNRIERPAIFYGVIGAAAIIVLLLVDLQLRKRAVKQRDEKTIATLFGTLQTEGGTIVDAIQSVKEAVSKKKKKTPSAVSPTTPQPTPGVDLTQVGTQFAKQETAPSVMQQPKIAPKKKLKKIKSSKNNVTISEPLQEVKPTEEVSLETDEPEKKVLTKEEFLKQFQKGGEQDE